MFKELALQKGESQISIGDRVWQPTWTLDIAAAINWCIENPWQEADQPDVARIHPQPEVEDHHDRWQRCRLQVVGKHARRVGDLLTERNAIFRSGFRDGVGGHWGFYTASLITQS